MVFSVPARSPATTRSCAVPGPTNEPPRRMLHLRRVGGIARTIASMVRTGAQIAAARRSCRAAPPRQATARRRQRRPSLCFAARTVQRPRPTRCQAAFAYPPGAAACLRPKLQAPADQRVLRSPRVPRHRSLRVARQAATRRRATADQNARSRGRLSPRLVRALETARAIEPQLPLRLIEVRGRGRGRRSPRRALRARGTHERRPPRDDGVHLGQRRFSQESNEAIIFPVITLTGGPYERGYQHGRKREIWSALQ
jgi:hypothetical protein